MDFVSSLSAICLLQSQRHGGESRPRQGAHRRNQHRTASAPRSQPTPLPAGLSPRWQQGWLARGSCCSQHGGTHPTTSPGHRWPRHGVRSRQKIGTHSSREVATPGSRAWRASASFHRSRPDPAPKPHPRTLFAPVTYGSSPLTQAVSSLGHICTAPCTTAPAP